MVVVVKRVENFGRNACEFTTVLLPLLRSSMYECSFEMNWTDRYMQSIDAVTALTYDLFFDYDHLLSWYSQECNCPRYMCEGNSTVVITGKDMRNSR